MPRWTIGAFDWVRYRALAPSIAAAADVPELRALGLQEAAQFLDELPDDMPIEHARNGLLIETCCRGEAVVLGKDLPELLIQLRRSDVGYDAAETLSELAFARIGVASWFGCDIGLVGLLADTQARELAAQLRKLSSGNREPGGRPAIQRLRSVFAPSEPRRGVLEELTEVVEEAGARGDGLAMVVE